LEISDLTCENMKLTTVLVHKRFQPENQKGLDGEWRREGRTESGVDHEKLHAGAYGRAAGGDLQVPSREPHAAPLATSCAIHKAQSVTRIFLSFAVKLQEIDERREI
jgi:hypothetical protein